MPLHFTRDEVQKHLDDLGFKNVDDEQLDQFLRDLRRLIKYEESHSKATVKSERFILISSTDSSSSAQHLPVGGNDDDDNFQRRKSLFVRRDTRKISYSPSKKSEILMEESICAASLSSKTACSASLAEKPVKVKISVTRIVEQRQDEEVDDVQLEDDFFHDSSTRLKQILPKRPKIPTRPTVSFIRPPLKPVAPKSDPVRLYHFYKRQWDKAKFPGDDSSKQLRWAVREWMMGHRDVVSRPK